MGRYRTKFDAGQKVWLLNGRHLSGPYKIWSVHIDREGERWYELENYLMATEGELFRTKHQALKAKKRMATND